jgi:hypothetical protein
MRVIRTGQRAEGRGPRAGDGEFEMLFLASPRDRDRDRDIDRDGDRDTP